MAASAPRAARPVGAGDEVQHAVAPVRIEERGEKAPRAFVRAGAELRKRAGDAGGLQAGESHRQSLAFRRDMKKALAPVIFALALHHVALVDQLLEHPAER